MNLEDRLRSHMHATPDLELGPGPSAGSIASAGGRRQRRRQVGSVIAGAVVAVGLVGGAAALLDDDSQGSDDFAATASTADEADFAEAAESDEGAMSEESFAIAESDAIDGIGRDEETSNAALPQDGADEAASMPAFGGEQIVGVDGGFAGLRADDRGELLFITSADGETWIESATTGIDADVLLSALAHNDGTFVALFERFDGSRSATQLGVSANGIDWELRDLDAGESTDEAAFFSRLAFGPGGILTVAAVQPVHIDSLEEAVAEESESSRSVAVWGPLEGPLKVAPLGIDIFGVDSVAVGDSGLAIVAFALDDRVLLTSTDGAGWLVGERVPTVVPAALARVNGEIVMVVATDERLLIDGRSIALTQPIPQVWSLQTATGAAGTAVLVSGDDGFSVLLFSDDGESWTELAFPPSISAENAVSLVAVGDDEVLVQMLRVDGSRNLRIPLV